MCTKLKYKFRFSIHFFLLIVTSLISNHLTFAQIGWQSIGPTGGNVQKIKSAPSDNSIIYCGMRDGSVLKSINNGKDWEFVGWFNEGISNLDIHPFDSNILYLGTNLNLYVTTNGGSDWHNIGWNGGGINSLTIDPIEPQNIYLSSVGNFGGIWKSTDTGTSWVFLNFPDNSGMTIAIRVDPDLNNILYAVSNLWKMYKSINYGGSWDITSDITGLPRDLVIDPSNTNILYLASSEGIFKSTDSGFSWNKKNNGDIDINHPWTENVIIDPTNTDHIFRTNNHNWTTFVSYNQGDTWMATELTAGSLTFTSDNIVLSGTRDGIYALDKSSDSVYYRSEGLYGTTIKSIVVSSLSNPIIFAVTEDQGIGKAYIYKLQLGNNDWQKSFWGRGVSKIKVSPFDPQIIIGGFNDWDTGLNITTDSGESWQVKSTVGAINAVEFSNNNSSVIFAGGLISLYKSYNLGNNWTQIALPSNYHAIDQIHVGQNDSIIFLGLDRGIDWDRVRTLLSSTNGGDTWFDHNIPSKSVLINHNSPNIILCGTSSGLLRSSDSGLNWIQINVANQSVNIHSINCYNDKIIFLATNQGVFYSNDKGLSWLILDKDLLHNNVLDLSFTEIPIPTIIIGTQGGGVYKKNIDDLTSVDDLVNKNNYYKLSNNFPNPFNPSTKITYAIPQSSFIFLIVYDVLGNEIAKLVNEEKPAGNYEVEFDGTGLSSGIYFYRLQAGDYVETKKMVLIR